MHPDNAAQVPAAVPAWHAWAMRARPSYPAPPPRREDLEEKLAPAIDLHQLRLERLATLCAPIHDAPVAPAPGLFGWLASPPAPTPEQRMRAAWRRVVLLRDRASLAAIEQDALHGQLEALRSLRDLYLRCEVLATDAPDEGAALRAYQGAAAVIEGVSTAIASAEPLLQRMLHALAALEADQEAQAVAAEGDLRGSIRSSGVDDVRGLDEVVVRLRACAVDQRAFERALADRLPIAPERTGPAWERADDELVEAEDPVRAWKDRRSR